MIGGILGTLTWWHMAAELLQREEKAGKSVRSDGRRLKVRLEGCKLGNRWGEEGHESEQKSNREKK